MSLDAITKRASDVAEHVKRQFGDEAGVQITDADILRWINSGQLEIVRKNKVIKAKSVTDVVEGVNEFNIYGLNIMQIESIHFNGRRLEHVEFAQAERIIADFDNGDAPSEEPFYWYEWGSLIYLYPVPSLSVVEGLTLYYSKMPTNVEAMDDLLSLPDKYFEPLITWVMHKAYQLDEEFDASNYERQQFQMLLDEDSEAEYTTAHITYPTITIVE